MTQMTDRNIYWHCLLPRSIWSVSSSSQGQTTYQWLLRSENKELRNSTQILAIKETKNLTGFYHKSNLYQRLDKVEICAVLGTWCNHPEQSSDNSTETTSWRETRGCETFQYVMFHLNTNDTPQHRVHRHPISTFGPIRYHIIIY